MVTNPRGAIWEPLRTLIGEPLRINLYTMYIHVCMETTEPPKTIENL